MRKKRITQIQNRHTSVHGELPTLNCAAIIYIYKINTRCRYSVTIDLGNKPCTVDPRYHEKPSDWQNTFAMTRFRYMEVLLFIYFTITGVKKIFRYTEDLVIQRFVISRFLTSVILNDYRKVITKGDLALSL